jgi:hypothetical protein
MRYSAALELDELERDIAPVATATDAIAQLGREWSQRRNGSPPVDAMIAWLKRDHADTLAGAKLRKGTRPLPPEVISRAWLISRREQMRFQLAQPAGLQPLRNFGPPASRVVLTSSPLIEESKDAPVSPLLIQFVQELRKRYANKFTASNYPGHGGGSFNNRGYSLDLTINGRDARGFYPPDAAIRFLRAVHQAAHHVGAEWRVLYNDFTVADALNRETGVAHVLFMGTVRRAANKTVKGLNWHGPHPLILHFHLDLAPGIRVTGTPIRSASPGRPVPVAVPPPPSPRPVQTPSSASQPSRAAKTDAVYALEIGRKPVPGMPGVTLGAFIEQWRQRICPEVPMTILLAFMRYESGGKFSDATHGTQKNGWTSPTFYELGLFQTPAGLHGKCAGKEWSSCQFGPPGHETANPSTWNRLCSKIGANPQDWQNPTTQVRVGLMDLEEGARSLRRDFPDLFPKPGSDWDLRMAVLYRFSRGGGYARSFLRPFRSRLAAMPESQRWVFLRDKTVTVKGAKGTIHRAFLPENVEKKMALAATLGYRPAHVG